MTKRLHPAHKLRKKVARALESGKYRQGRGFLRTAENTEEPDGPKVYCCLGVAADCVFNAEWVKSYDTWVFQPSGTNNEILLGEEWADTLFGDVAYEDSHPQNQFAWLNDSGATFEQIARLFRLDGEQLTVANQYAAAQKYGNLSANQIADKAYEEATR